MLASTGFPLCSADQTPRKSWFHSPSNSLFVAGRGLNRHHEKYTNTMCAGRGIEVMQILSAAGELPDSTIQKRLCHERGFLLLLLFLLLPLLSPPPPLPPLVVVFRDRKLRQ